MQWERDPFVNERWLIAQIDKIHDALCPGESGTWQIRAEQAVEAVMKIAMERPDVLGLCRHPWASYLGVQYGVDDKPLHGGYQCLVCETYVAGKVQVDPPNYWRMKIAEEIGIEIVEELYGG